MSTKSVFRYETSEDSGKVAEQIEKTYHRYMSEGVSADGDFIFRLADKSFYPTFLCTSQKTKNGKKRPEAIVGKKVYIETRVTNTKEKTVVEVRKVNGWHKFFPLNPISIVLLIVGAFVTPLAQYYMDWSDEIPFVYDYKFHLGAFLILFAVACLIEILSRLTEPREDPSEVLDKFAEYIVSDIPNLRKITE